MKKQAYSNHIRAYPPHHFVFYPLILILLVFTVRRAIIMDDERVLWSVISAVILLIGYLSFMTRQHYALTLQNRLVRLEMRLRYYQLTGERLEPLEETLGFTRLAALRFCTDSDLVAMVRRALAENLSAKDIKKEIPDWYPDHMRV